jgi:dihydroneopterin aldolase
MKVDEKTEVNDKYFSNLSSRERAIFEGAISMGALFHQFIGTPVSKKNARLLEKAMQESLELQPCINRVEIKISNQKLNELNTEFDYVSLSGDMLDVKIFSEFEEKTALIRMQYLDELKYPLMYVERADE